MKKRILKKLLLQKNVLNHLIVFVEQLKNIFLNKYIFKYHESWV